MEKFIKELNKKGFQAEVIPEELIIELSDNSGAFFDDQGLIEANLMGLEWEILKYVYDNRSLIKEGEALWIYN